MAGVAVARVGVALLSSDARRLVVAAAGALFLGLVTIVFVIVTMLRSVLGFAGSTPTIGLLPGVGGAPGPLARPSPPINWRSCSTSLRHHRAVCRGPYWQVWPRSKVTSGSISAPRRRVPTGTHSSCPVHGKATEVACPGAPRIQHSSRFLRRSASTRATSITHCRRWPATCVP